MMSRAFTSIEIKSIITQLKTALIQAAASGGVTSYTLNTGQGSTTVHSASLEEITNSINYFQGLLNEIIEVETGSNITYVRDLGI